MLARRSTDCAMLTCFQRLIVHIQETISNQIALRTIENLKWLQKNLAIENLELSILTMLTRRSNRLSYVDLFLTVEYSYSKDY